MNQEEGFKVLHFDGTRHALSFGSEAPAVPTQFNTGVKNQTKGKGFVSIGGSFSKPASRARGITSTKLSWSIFRMLLATSVGSLIVPNLLNLLL